MATTAPILTADQLNALGKQTGYTGPAITSVGLPTVPTTLSSANTSPTTSLASQVTNPPVSNPTPLVNNGNALVASGNAQVTANQAAAAALGITIPGVGGGGTSTTGNPPAGWDAQTYANFKSANPGLEPTAEDTAKMQAAGQGTDPTTAYINNLIKGYGTPPSVTDTYTKTYGITPEQAQQQQAQAQADLNAKNATYKTAQSKLAGFNAQLAAMNLQNTATNTALETEGGAITSRGVGTAQAQNSRDNLIAQAPIQFQALMAQADVATAQGDVQLAQSIQQQAQGHLDDLFKAQTTDATNQYNYQKDLIDKAYAFADKQQQQQLDTQKQTLATNQSNLADARNFAQQLSTAATSNGQGSIAAQLASIPQPDINSKTFASDLQNYNTKIATLQKQIVPKSTSSNETWSSPYNLGSKSVQRNNTTGEIRTIGDATSDNNGARTSTYPSTSDGDKSYVNDTLAKQGVSYASAEANTPKGFVYAINNRTGATELLNAKDWKDLGSSYTSIYNNLK